MFPIGINIIFWTRINPRYKHIRYDLCLTNKAFPEWCWSRNSLSYLKKIKRSTILGSSNFHLLPISLTIDESWVAWLCTEKSSSSRRGRWRRHDGGSSTLRRSPPDLPRRHRALAAAAGKLFPDIIALLHFNSTCFFFIVPLSSVICVYSLLAIEAPFLVLQTYYFTMRNAELPIIWAVKWYLRKTCYRKKKTEK